MDLATVVILTVILVVGACIACNIYIKHRKSGKDGIPWNTLRPILTATYTEALGLMKAQKLGYQAIEDYAVILVKSKVEQAVFLSAEEKALLSDSVIRVIISPMLIELYKQNIKK